MLSIKVAVDSVTLVGLVIKGINPLLYMISLKSLLDHVIQLLGDLYYNLPSSNRLSLSVLYSPLELQTDH